MNDLHFERVGKISNPTRSGQKTAGFSSLATNDAPFIDLSLPRGRSKVKIVSSNDVKGSMTAPRTVYSKSL